MTTELSERLDRDAAAEARSRKRPLVTLSYAQSLDGSIAARRGSPLALSSPESLRLTHQLRALHQGILVGVGTVLADDPQLTVRMVRGKSPRPIVLDSWLRTPSTARLLQSRGPRPWIFATEAAEGQRQAILEQAGARVFRMPADSAGRVDLHRLMATLTGLGIRRLMVEGGAEVITAFLSQGLVDRLVITIAPVFVGGQRSLERLLHPKEATFPLVPSDAHGHGFPSLQEVRYEKLGRDLIVWGVFDREGV